MSESAVAEAPDINRSPAKIFQEAGERAAAAFVGRMGRVLRSGRIIAAAVSPSKSVDNAAAADSPASADKGGAIFLDGPRSLFKDQTPVRPARPSAVDISVAERNASDPTDGRSPQASNGGEDGGDGQGSQRSRETGDAQVLCLVQEIREEMRQGSEEMRQAMQQLRQDVMQEVQDVRQEMQQLRQEMRAGREEWQEQVNSLRSEHQRLAAKVTGMTTNLHTQRDVSEQLAAEVQQLRTEFQQSKDTHELAMQCEQDKLRGNEVQIGTVKLQVEGLLSGIQHERQRVDRNEAQLAELHRKLQSLHEQQQALTPEKIHEQEKMVGNLARAKLASKTTHAQ